MLSFKKFDKNIFISILKMTKPHREISCVNDILSFIDDYKINIDLFERIKGAKCKLGRNASIYLYIERATKKQVIAKIVDIKRQEKRFYNKIALNVFVSCHPCFNKFIGFHIPEKRKNKGTIFLEFCPNWSLDVILEEKRKEESKVDLNDTNKLIIIYGIATGMAFLHSHDIINGNLKPENVLLDEYLHPKLCDFGTANEIEDVKTSKTVQQTTAAIMPPEFLDNYEEYNRTKPIDVFSFAMVVYEIITEDEPFAGYNPLQIVEKTLKNERPEFNKPIAECYRNLIERCWSQEPGKRPTFDEIVEELENNTEFITENSIDSSEYYKYIEYTKNPESVSYESSDEIQIERTRKEFQPNVKAIDLRQFEKQEKIGSGSFGKVYKVKEKSTNKIYACKISKMITDYCKDNQIRNMKREVEIISKLKHPSILEFIGFNPMNFKYERRPTFITELIPNGSLDELLEIDKKGLSGDNWDDTKKLIIIYGIAKGMSYLHSLNILHRDLKPGNIFIDEYLFPKIGDFGLSKELIAKDAKETSTMNNMKSGELGTIPYMSPEIMSDSEYTKSGDVYAFGIIVYQIVTNEELYSGWFPQQIQFNVNNGYRPKIPSDTKDCYRELIERCWNQNPDERPTFDEIVEALETNREFITDTIEEEEFFSYVDYLEQLLSKKETNPNDDETSSEDKSEEDKKEENTEKENLIETLAQSFQKFSIDLKLAEDTYDENDPIFKEGFLDLTPYEVVKQQSKGDTWKLCEVRNKESGTIYTAKITTIKLNKMGRSDIINLSHEINNISQIKHPSILEFIGYSQTDFSGKRRPVIVSEYASNGTISSLLDKERRKQHQSGLSATQKLIVIYGIAEGMRYLHSHKIVHRDLTPENIYLDDKMNSKIGNFGLSTHIHTRDSMTFQSTVGVKGNPVYSAPEVLQMNEYSKSSDVYSFGMVVYEIMTTKQPFSGLSGLNQLFNEVVLKSIRPEMNEDISESYRQLIEYCWSQNPDERPSFDDIVDILKTDKRFITEEVDVDKYLECIKSIENSKIEFYDGKKIFNEDELIKSKSKIIESNPNNDATSSSSDEEETNNKDKDNNNKNQNDKIEDENNHQNKSIGRTNEETLKPEDIKIEHQKSEGGESKIKIREEGKEEENQNLISERLKIQEVEIEINEEPKEEENQNLISEEPKLREIEIKVREEPKEEENQDVISEGLKIQEVEIAIKEEPKEEENDH